jgi:23S rRNA (uridine2552-2'-O)-methyltransferase|tara:strand:- start:939 stop:1520 length:582 start_codon:yes stop_codon:yes gene_type:complete
VSKNESYFSGEKYNLKAKKLGYRSRAAFKLIDINKKENILRKNLNIIDLGSAPGGWSQVVSKELNGTGSIIAIDILDMPKIKDVKFIKSDLREFDQNKLNQPIDVVISDIAPNISGVRFIDDTNMIDLLEIELSIVDKTLVKGGNFLAKCFEGGSSEFLRKEINKRFKIMKRLKPDSSRKISKEIYLLGLNKN